MDGVCLISGSSMFSAFCVAHRSTYRWLRCNKARYFQMRDSPRWEVNNHVCFGAADVLCQWTFKATRGSFGFDFVCSLFRQGSLLIESPGSELAFFNLFRSGIVGSFSVCSTSVLNVILNRRPMGLNLRKQISKYHHSFVVTWCLVVNQQKTGIGSQGTSLF